MLHSKQYWKEKKDTVRVLEVQSGIHCAVRTVVVPAIERLWQSRTGLGPVMLETLQRPASGSFEVLGGSPVHLDRLRSVNTAELDSAPDARCASWP